MTDISYIIDVRRFDGGIDRFYFCKGSSKDDAIEKLKQKIIDSELSEYYDFTFMHIID